jgi:hypothetical protein
MHQEGFRWSPASGRLASCSTLLRTRDVLLGGRGQMRQSRALSPSLRVREQRRSLPPRLAFVGRRPCRRARRRMLVPGWRPRIGPVPSASNRRLRISAVYRRVGKGECRTRTTSTVGWPRISKRCSTTSGRRCVTRKQRRALSFNAPPSGRLHSHEKPRTSCLRAAASSCGGRAGVVHRAGMRPRPSNESDLCVGDELPREHAQDFRARAACDEQHASGRGGLRVDRVHARVPEVAAAMRARRS